MNLATMSTEQLHELAEDVQRELADRCDVANEARRAFGTIQRENPGAQLVPIHAVRAIVRDRSGGHAASHTVLDPVLHEHRQKRTWRMIAISDHSDATPEQLRDSVQGVHETLFYLRG